MPQVENVSLGGGQIAMLSTTVSLTSAQILALFTTPITLVPAPGAGKVIVPVQIAYVYSFVTHPYRSSGGGTPAAQYSGGPGSNINGGVLGITDGANSAIYYNGGFVNNPQAILPGANNQAVVLSATAELADGPIVTSTLGAGGANYAVNDTGAISNGANDATYEVLTVGAGGAVLTYQITGAGTKCTVANGNATVDGGAQPGVGVGFTVNITAVQTGDGTLKVVTYYQIIPVP